MDLYLGGDSLTSGLDPDAAVHVMGDRGDDRHDDERPEHPADQELYERQLEDIEADVLVELRVFDAEVHAVEEQHGLLPLPAGAAAHNQGEQDGDHHAHQPTAMANRIVIVAEQVLLRSRWTGGRSQAVGYRQVGVHQQEEQDDEDDRQDDLVDQDLGPDVSVA